MKAVTQVFASLPSQRIILFNRFEVISPDYADAWFVNDNKSKVHILLISWTVTEVHHLVLVTSVDMETFLMSFTRFVEGCVMPTVFYCESRERNAEN